MSTTTTTDHDTNRSRRRRLLYLVGLVPSLLLLMVSVRIGVLLHHESRAMSAYAAGDFEQAQEHFAANRVFNPVERWIAPFGEGDARFRLEDHEEAVEAFEAALGLAPEDQECMIRVNLGLTHEAHADSLVADGNRAEATEARLRGRDVLKPCKEVTALAPEELQELQELEELADLLPKELRQLRPRDMEALAEQLAELSPEQVSALLSELMEQTRERRGSEARSRLAAALVDLRLARSLGAQQADRARPPEEPPPDDEATKEKRRQVEERSKKALEDHVKHKDEFDSDSEPPPPAPSATPQW